jgi:phytoene dehydrogenase-like protein
MIPAEDLKELIEQAFLEQVGELQVRERVWVPGDPREAELREAAIAIDELTEGRRRDGPDGVPGYRFTTCTSAARITLSPYAIGVPGRYICSAATSPGPGAHGMCGTNAAQAALGYLARRAYGTARIRCCFRIRSRILVARAIDDELVCLAF